MLYNDNEKLVNYVIVHRSVSVPFVELGPSLGSTSRLAKVQMLEKAYFFNSMKTSIVEFILK